MKTNKTEEKKCKQVCHGIHILHGEHCQKEQPSIDTVFICQKCRNKKDRWKPGAIVPYCVCEEPTPRPELKCKCNDIEYCSTCIDSPKAPVSWKDRLNKCFRFKRSLDDRHIYYLADDDDDETQYGYLDQFIEVLMMQAEQKAREEERKRCAEIIKKIGNGCQCSNYCKALNEVAEEGAQQILNPKSHHE